MTTAAMTRVGIALASFAVGCMFTWAMRPC